jgi:drug/metabolite transporter (DMT)-like permease
MVGAVTLGAVNGALFKALTPLLNETMIAWTRYAAVLAVLLPIAAWRNGAALLRPQQPLLQLLRGLFQCVATWAFVAAVVGMPVADAIALIYVYPFMVTAMAPALLGERVPLVAWLGVVSGFAGVVIVMQPELSGVNGFALLAVLCGVAIAFITLIGRKLAFSADPLASAVYSALTGTVLFAWPLPWDWQPIGAQALLFVAALGLISATNQWMMLVAFRHAKASVLAPVGYTEIVAGVIVGFLWFGDVPGVMVWIGMAVIIASGVLVARVRR